MALVGVFCFNYIIYSYLQTKSFKLIMFDVIGPLVSPFIRFENLKSYIYDTKTTPQGSAGGAVGCDGVCRSGVDRAGTERFYRN